MFSAYTLCGAQIRLALVQFFKILILDNVFALTIHFRLQLIISKKHKETGVYSTGKKKKTKIVWHVILSYFNFFRFYIWRITMHGKTFSTLQRLYFNPIDNFVWVITQVCGALGRLALVQFKKMLIQDNVLLWRSIFVNSLSRVKARVIPTDLIRLISLNLR